ncbi:fatty acid--CoA ligase family protein [bacterium]|nr:fatty acid--CoA ligase family protein [bacterium]MBU4509900.1 fatty acid--CoA ligase family protein [bacterium]
MFIDFIIQKFKNNLKKEAIICDNKIYSYKYLLNRYYFWKDFLNKRIEKGKIVAVQADYNPDSVTLMLALIENANIFVPFSHSNKDIKKKLEIAEAEYFIKFKNFDYNLIETNNKVSHNLIKKLKQRNHPGIIVFSSGSTGEPKAAIHDFTNLLNKFKVERKTLRTIIFLLFDHWGGINTLLYIFSNAGLIGVPVERSPDKVCEFIEKYKIELLPTTPTFINLILMSRAYNEYNLSSLKIVSYGTEAMPGSTLKFFHNLFPKIELKQTYGLTELGVMRTKSKSSDSLWLKVGGEDYKTKVIDNTLFIKAKSSILGYLNAESPFDKDGWYNTGDKIEQDGDWIRFLGRESEIINVGGQKVYPTEVESVLLEINGVKDAIVYGEKNPLMGEIVVANVKVDELDNNKKFISLIKKYCREKLDKYKIPVKINFTQKDLISERFKRSR